jgi:hypothetical protein
MEKHNVTSIGAILLASVFLRPFGTSAVKPSPVLDGPPATTAASSFEPQQLHGEGPWIASCQYWAPARPASFREESRPSVSVKLTASESKIESDITSTKEEEASCPASVDSWGIPITLGSPTPTSNSSGLVSIESVSASNLKNERPAADNAIRPIRPYITAIIAIVPDPDHANMSLLFDRTVDAILQAANDNHYVESNSWLPWQAPGATDVKMAHSSGENIARLREHEPGLIILKHAPVRDDKTSGFEHPIYLFLVRGSQTLGIDGEQMQRALAYEDLLREKHPGAVSLSARYDKPNEVAIIGSGFSGAAASLRAAIDLALSRDHLRRVRIADRTTTDLALKTLTQNVEEKQIHFVSFEDSDKAEESALSNAVRASAYDPARVVELLEDNTAFGSSNAGYSEGAVTQLREALLAKFPDDVFELLIKKLHDHPSIDMHKLPDESQASYVTRLQSTLFAGVTLDRKDVSEIAGALLVSQQGEEKDAKGASPRMRTIRFPRGISLLRNAHPDDSQSGADVESTPGPYLHLSLRDSGKEEGIPHFSPEQMPVSQEAQLIAIVRELHRDRAQIVVIAASDVLDEVFLVKTLHRMLPDVRLVTLGGGDLLYEREVDNIPFVGTITLTPYNLVTATPRSDLATEVRVYPDASSQATYDAASYIFWDGLGKPELASYEMDAGPSGYMSAALWATVVGRDGYYPLGRVSDCASDDPHFLPSFKVTGAGIEESTVSCDNNVKAVESAEASPVFRPMAPPLAWLAICFLVIVVCIAHCAGLFGANLWSPFTRDLAIERNDEPSRRALYIQIGSTMLWCLSIVAALPLLPFRHTLSPDPAVWFIFAATLLAGLWTWGYATLRTLPHVFPSHMAWLCTHLNPRVRFDCICRQTRKGYRIFYLLSLAAGVLIPSIWALSCGLFGLSGREHYVGLSFSLRCLNPVSAVSPASPVLFLLAGWYVWSIFQTQRLRFSESSRPRLPKSFGSFEERFLFVSDSAVTQCGAARSPSVCDALTSLMITPVFISPYFPKLKPWQLAAGYLLWLLVCMGLGPVTTPERLLWIHHHWPTPYEALVQIIFYPLMLITLTNWLRMILIWGALDRNVLRPLEQRPIRFAFDRLKGTGWLAVMRQNGLVQRWREMARSVEAMRQMHTIPELAPAFALVSPFPVESYVRQTAPSLNICDMRRSKEGRSDQPGQQYDTDLLIRLNRHVSTLQDLVSTRGKVKGTQKEKETIRQENDKKLETNYYDREVGKLFREFLDLPDEAHECELLLLYLIENDFAEFSEALLRCTLVPHWQRTRVEFVESELNETIAVHAKRVAKEESETPKDLSLHLAEEFLAIRYLSLIRAVLVNVRHLMIFVATAFVLSIVSWNSYPFRPRQWVDAGLTALLFILGSGIVWVLAQVHRDPILSRITRTRPNELGSEFFLRVAAVGTVPVLTWMAYQFPSISDSILRYLQPGLEATLK